MIIIKATKVLLFLLITSSSMAQVNAGTMLRRQAVETKDSIEYYEVDISTRQKSYLNLLTGTWNITSMKSASKKEPIQLKAVTLTIKPDSSFTGIAGCNNIWGKFTIMGTSIKFVDIGSTRKFCPRQEEENAMLLLLRQVVSNYSVTKPELILRDVSGVSVFEAKRN